MDRNRNRGASGKPRLRERARLPYKSPVCPDCDRAGFHDKTCPRRED